MVNRSTPGQFLRAGLRRLLSNREPATATPERRDAAGPDEVWEDDDHLPVEAESATPEDPWAIDDHSTAAESARPSVAIPPDPPAPEATPPPVQGASAMDRTGSGADPPPPQATIPEAGASNGPQDSAAPVGSSPDDKLPQPGVVPARPALSALPQEKAPARDLFTWAARRPVDSQQAPSAGPMPVPKTVAPSPAGAAAIAGDDDLALDDLASMEQGVLPPDWENGSAGLIEDEWDSDWDSEVGGPDGPVAGSSDSWVDDDIPGTGVLDDDDAVVDDFDPDARQNPWAQDSSAGDDPDLRKARSKAAIVAILLAPSGAARNDTAVSFLSHFFERHRAGATFAAIHRIAEQGLDLATLRQMVELRDEWALRLEWWRVRWYGEIRPTANGRLGLTWRLAQRICRARSHHPVEDMIDDEWMDEWLHLAMGEQGERSFAEYIAIKVDAVDAENLHAGLIADDRHSDPRDLAAGGAWQRHAQDGRRIIGIIEAAPIVDGPYRRRVPATAKGGNAPENLLDDEEEEEEEDK